MKTVLLVPGYTEGLKDRDYPKVIRAIESQGYKVKFVPIEWKRKTIVDWANELDKVYYQYQPDDVILSGFSYGAMTAFLSASRRNPHELWLFSLSPYFKEDLFGFKPWMLKLTGKARCEEFEKLEFKKLSPMIKCRTLIFAGSKEMHQYEDLKLRSEIAKQEIKNSRLIVVEGAGHNVDNDHYVESILKNI